MNQPAVGGAQLLAYAAYQLGGHPTLALVAAAFVVAAFVVAAVGARALGAGPRAIVLVFFPVILAAPWAWTIRAQVFVLPLFTTLVWLLASEARRPSKRVYIRDPAARRLGEPPRERRARRAPDHAAR